MRELDSAFGVAELAVDRGEISETLAEAEDAGGGVGGGGGGGGEAEGRGGYVMVDELHCVDEVYIEEFGSSGLAVAAESEENGR